MELPDAPPVVPPAIPELHLTEAVAGGSIACAPEGRAWADARWAPATSPDPALQTDASTSVTVVDNVSRGAVGLTTVDVWRGDPIDAPDSTVDPAEDGTLTVPDTVCTPTTFAVRHATRPWAYSRTHLPPPGTSVVLPVTREATADALFATAGLPQAVDDSLIVGSVFGCDRDPAQAETDRAGALKNVQIVVRDAADAEIEGAVVLYDDTVAPDRLSPGTRANGRFTVVGVPSGYARVEAWALVEGEPQIVGATELEVRYRSAVHADVFAGSPDGWKLPAA
ncbi:MAG: hypothetical protein KC656_20540, partial [Myxococcales bacterium]|nr:hypothetical protein [Myxococcales bacterium]